MFNIYSKLHLIIVSAIVLMLVYIWYLKSTILDLEIERAILIDNQSKTDSLLEIQNNSIKSIELDYNKSMIEYVNSISKIKSIDLKSDDCDDIKKALNDLKNS